MKKTENADSPMSAIVRTSHEEGRECRQPDVGHRVVAVTPRPFALAGKTGADLAQLPDQLLNGTHLVQESVIDSRHKRKLLYTAQRDRLLIIWASR